MSSASVRRLIFTLATGYLTVFALRHTPFEFDNEWIIIVPALIIVYVLTIWIEGKIFKQDVSEIKDQRLKKNESTKKGFGS